MRREAEGENEPGDIKCNENNGFSSDGFDGEDNIGVSPILTDCLGDKYVERQIIQEPLRRTYYNRGVDKLLTFGKVLQIIGEFSTGANL